MERESEELEAGLRHAYGKKSAGREDSILATIAALTGAVPRVLLRDIHDETSPLVRPGGGETDSERYQVLGEIGRGGVGVVLKSRDVDLGRDVAMKVLRSSHEDNPELLQRFVEEAQIGGQLQHPGIVPVYELGLNAHRQPYFTMKLVKGETLSALLRKRESARSERGRFISVFEKVCQTMAYAHARGVIHRDLKPANIMVGAFGEVQIVDWGFAKILRQGGVEDERRVKDQTIVETVRSGSVGSESHAGSVMGTPAYMPPEQALGEVDKLDERADAFALGAILCEILTGTPPYVEGDQALLVQAAEANLDSARSRLDACGADVDLIQLAKRCLSPAAAVRPKDASMIAKAIRDYTSDVEERARQADMQRVRADEEVKRRKLTIALAATVLVAVVGTGSGLYWAEQEQQRSREAALVPVEEARERVLIAKGEAHADLSRWDEVERVMAEYSRIAGSEQKVERARLFAEIHAARTAAEYAEKQRLADAALKARLLEVFTWRGDHFEANAREAAYAKALDGYDAKRIRKSAIRKELNFAVCDWGEAGRGDAIDPDTSRASDPDVPTDGRSADDCVLLADRLGRSGDIAGARAILRAAVQRSPKHFKSLFALGWWLTEGQSDYKEAARVLTRACRSIPQNIGARYLCGWAHFLAANRPAAIEQWAAVYARKPDFAEVRKYLKGLLNERAVFLRQGGQNTAALECARQALAVDPDDSIAMGNVGLYTITCEIGPGDAKAIELLRRATEAATDGQERGQTLYGLVDSLWTTGRFEECVEVGKRAVEEFPQHRMRWLGDWRRGYALAWLGRVEEAQQVLNEATKSRRMAATTRDDLLAIGYARAGNHERAIELTRSVLKTKTAHNRFDWHERIVRFLRADGRTSEAFDEAKLAHEELGKLLEGEPDNVGYLNNFARALVETRVEELRDPVRAVTMLEKADELRPDNITIQSNLGIAYCLAGRHAEAIERLESPARRVLSGQTWAPLHAYLAIAYFKSGKHAEAKQVMAKMELKAKYRFLDERDQEFLADARAVLAGKE